MKTFNNLEEMKPYYNANTNTYDFMEDGNVLDIKINFDLKCSSCINAYDINAYDITAYDITAHDITAHDITAGDINAGDINAHGITAGDINANDIHAGNINAYDINAYDITAGDINAHGINAGDINAGDINAHGIDAGDINAHGIDADGIKYYAVCFAYQNIKCKSIKGYRKNAKHFCLDGAITIKLQIEEMTLEQVCEALGKEIVKDK